MSRAPYEGALSTAFDAIAVRVRELREALALQWSRYGEAHGPAAAAMVPRAPNRHERRAAAAMARRRS